MGISLLSTGIVVASVMIYGVLAALTVSFAKTTPVYYLVIEFFGVVLCAAFIGLITHYFSSRYARQHPMEFHYQTHSEKQPTPIILNAYGQVVPDGVVIEMPKTIMRHEGPQIPLTPKTTLHALTVSTTTRHSSLHQLNETSQTLSPSFDINSSRSTQNNNTTLSMTPNITATQPQLDSHLTTHPSNNNNRQV